MAEASKIELGFEGGGVLRCDVGEAAFEELAAAFSVAVDVLASRVVREPTVRARRSRGGACDEHEPDR